MSNRQLYKKILYIVYILYSLKITIGIIRADQLLNWY